MDNYNRITQASEGQQIGGYKSPLAAERATLGGYGQAVNATPQKSAMELILQELEGKIQSLLHNNGRLDGLRIRLRGENPPSNCGEKSPLPSGILGQISDRLNTLTSLIGSQASIISDLEKFI